MTTNVINLNTEYKPPYDEIMKNALKQKIINDAWEAGKISQATGYQKAIISKMIRDNAKKNLRLVRGNNGK